MKFKYLFAAVCIATFSYLLTSCTPTPQTNHTNTMVSFTIDDTINIEQKVKEYETVKLTADLSALSENDKDMIPLLMKAADIIDAIFWEQAFGDKKELLDSITDEHARQFALINYGPWDRLDGMQPFIAKYDSKPLGANFYPADIKYLQYINMKFEDKYSMYTLIRKNQEGDLYTIPYHKAYQSQLEKAVKYINKAIEICDNPDYKRYLELRTKALLSDDYIKSDMTWMDLKDHKLDFIIGPIEDVEDRFLNIKTAYEAYLIIKDEEWSKKLEKYASILPDFQKTLPVDEKYKQEIPVSESEIGVYDVIYYAGLANTGGKSISINHPKDKRVVMEKGNKKLEFKNVMKAKFEKILAPISNELISEEQRSNINFDAFFENNMFYELAYGLGTKYTVNDKGSVKVSLKDYFNTINETKANILRLFLITQLHDNGELTDNNLMDNYVTFLADNFRSVRFGASHEQGKANMIGFNYFIETEAFTRNDDGTYSVNLEKMKESVTELSSLILTIQGDGDYQAAKELVVEKGIIKETLKIDLFKLSQAGIPRDIIFEQGADVLGL